MFSIKLSILFFLVINLIYSDDYSCLIATQKFEKKYELPNKLLLSMALTESGRKVNNVDFISWPWTVNYKGKGRFFSKKEEAVEFVTNYTRNGKRNIDIGCMQINYMYHPEAFKNFNDAFDPDLNVEWSAKLVKGLYERFGSWKKAVGYYHSYRTSKRNKYSAKVFNTWLDIKKNNKYADINLKVLSDYTLVASDAPEVVKIKKDIPVKNRKDENNNEKKDLVSSPYIVARMEKVKFFREYFLSSLKN